MSFPSTWAAIREMIENSLLQTEMARSIVRKSGIRPGVGAVSTGDSSVELLQEIARADAAGPNHSVYGWQFAYPASAFPNPFPGFDAARQQRYGDFRRVTDIRLLVNVSKAGPPGGVIYLTLVQDIGNGPTDIPEISFEGGAPSVPADSVGFHDSGWKTPLWLPDPFEFRPAQTEVVFTNPTAVSGTMGVGMCQILLRRSV